MDQFDEYGENAKGIPVPVMMGCLAEIYSELARDPVMTGPAMYVRQALLELEDLCALARQVQLEDHGIEQAAPSAKSKKHSPGRRKLAKRNEVEVPAEQKACLTPLASLHPYSFLKQ